MNGLLDMDHRAKPVGAASFEKPAAKKMSMALINLILDAALFLTIIGVMWISVMLQVIFPAPTLAAGWSLWGFTFDQWRDAQFHGLCLFALLSIEHLALHWNWVCCTIATHVMRLKTRPDEANQAVYGVGTLISILVTLMLTLIAALFSVSRPTI